MDISAGGGVSRESREENIGFIYVVSGTATSSTSCNRKIWPAYYVATHPTWLVAVFSRWAVIMPKIYLWNHCLVTSFNSVSFNMLSIVNSNLQKSPFALHTLSKSFPGLVPSKASPCLMTMISCKILIKSSKPSWVILLLLGLSYPA